MRIPISDNEVGIWYPIYGSYFFVSKKSSNYCNSITLQSHSYRESTFAEFKIELPYLVNNKNEYRCKTKKHF